MGAGVSCSAMSRHNAVLPRAEAVRATQPPLIAATLVGADTEVLFAEPQAAVVRHHQTGPPAVVLMEFTHDLTGMMLNATKLIVIIRNKTATQSFLYRRSLTSLESAWVLSVCLWFHRFTGRALPKHTILAIRSSCVEDVDSRYAGCVSTTEFVCILVKVFHWVGSEAFARTGVVW